jgi:hypothetical protein
MNTANFPRNRERKQAEALVRQATSAALPPEARLAALDADGLRAVKERAKLAKRIEQANKSVTTVNGTSIEGKAVIHGPSTLAAPAEPRVTKPRRRARTEKRGA